MTTEASSGCYALPVQLRDANPRAAARGDGTDDFDATRFTAFETDDLGFVDLSGFQVDLQAIRACCSRQSPEQRPRKRAKIEAAAEDDAGEQKERIILGTTECLFEVRNNGIHEADLTGCPEWASAKIRIVGRAPSKAAFPRFADTVADGQSLQGRPTPLAGAYIVLDGQIEEQELRLATLPILSGSDADPRGLTNAAWLAAAARLQSASRLELQAKVRLDDSATLPRASAIGPSGPPTLSLRLSVTVLLTSQAFLPAGDCAIARDVVHVLQFLGTGQGNPRLRSSAAHGQAEAVSHLYSALQPFSGEPPPFSHPDLFVSVLPFQRGSVQHLLLSEGATQPDLATDSADRRALWWTQVETTDGQALWFHPMYGHFVRSNAAELARQSHGSLLADEMGLGKTIEVLALIVSHTASTSWLEQPAVHRTDLDVWTRNVKATLIVAPETLRQQWLDEISQHCPALTVYNFTSHTQAAKDARKAGLDGWSDMAVGFDIVVTTFDTLRRELHAARSAPQRSRRHTRKYERPRSPLVQVAFHRICMDEVQLVGDASAAETLSLIARAHSIAVSGTPFETVEDLAPCMRFLKVPGMELKNAAAHLESFLMRNHLGRLLNSIGVRHLKAEVEDQLRIPPQTHRLVPIHFTSIESAFYEDQKAAGLRDAGLSQEDLAAVLDESTARTLLSRLRRACTHPGIVLRTMATGLGSLANLQLSSIDDVLDLMIEGVHSELFSVTMARITKEIDRAQLTLQERGDLNRVETALPVLNQAKQDIEDCMHNVAEQNKNAHWRGPLYRFDESTEADPIDVEQEPQGDRQRARQMYVGTLRNRNRECLEKLHRIHQFTGDACSQMCVSGEAMGAQVSDGERPASDIAEWRKREDAAYEAADRVRMTLLSDSLRAAKQASDRLSKRPDPFDDSSRPASLAQEDVRSILLSRQCADLEHLQLTLDRQWELCRSWRRRLCEHLLHPLHRDVDKENANDDQYRDNLNSQHAAEAILEMYPLVLADREFFLTGRRAIGSEDKPRLYAEVEAAVRETRRLGLLGVTAPASVRDEHKDQLALFQTLDGERKGYNGSVTPAAHTIAAIRQRLDFVHAAEEDVLIKHSLKQARGAYTEHLSRLDELRKDLQHLFAVFNARSTYFKQLQALSDAVADLPSSDVPSARDRLVLDSARLAARCESLRRRLRYLTHISTARQKDDAPQEASECFMCTDPIEKGILTDKCGHLACEECFMRWIKARRACPMCNSKVNGPQDFHRISYLHSGPGKASSHASNLGLFEEQAISSADVKAIQRVPSQGHYGSKIDFLLKHILFRSQQSRSKAIVFSAFAVGLDIVAEGLRANGIKYSRLQGGGKQGAMAVRAFNDDPDTTILLLHAEAHSSGLNLLSATTIFLLEPLLDRSTALQAMGRVHRIGQVKETEIFQCVVDDTVERIIARQHYEMGTSDGAPNALAPAQIISVMLTDRDNPAV